MHFNKKKRLSAVGAFGLIMIGGVISGWATRVFSQQELAKTIHQSRANIQDPVRVKQLLVNGIPVIHDKAFQAGTDWMSNTMIVVENRSPKYLTCVRFRIEFPEDGDHSTRTGPLITVPVVAGVIPSTQLHTSAGKKVDIQQQPAILVSPGGTIKIHLASSLPRIRSTVESLRALSDINEVKLWIDQAFFSDGTRWSLGGQFARESPQKQGQYVSLTPDEFYRSPGLQ